jgi:hypothetical protein
VRILIVQPVADPAPGRSPYRHEVALVGARLVRPGSSVALAVFRTSDEAALKAAIAEARPEAILLYVETLAVDLAFRIAESLREMQSATLLLFGPYARQSPDEALSRPGVEAVAVGPADLCLPRFLETPAAASERLQVRGMWVNCASGVMRNPPPPPPANLKREPPPARELYGLHPVLDPAGFAEVCVSRGGQAGPKAPLRPQPEAAWPGPTPWPVLHRPVEAVLAEMAALAGVQLDLVGFFVTNDRWAAAPWYLRDFAARYPTEIDLPLRTTLHAPDVTVEAAQHLARAGCEEARLVVGSGSTLIRSDILGLEATPEQFRAAFAVLARAGIRSVARVEIGAPYETRLTLRETVRFLRELDPDRVEAVLHWPEPGSASFEAARENGLLVPDPAGAYLDGRPALALPGLTEQEVLTACEAVPYAVHRPRTAALIRAARRVKVGKRRTLYDLVLRPLLGPPLRKRRRAGTVGAPFNALSPKGRGPA